MKLESKLAQKVEEGHDEQECDDIRAKVILAKGKLAEASGALATCLSTKKMIQAKIDAVETARKSAQTGLDQCLATKARLKTALEECHKRRDSAKEKLKACLDRKKELKVKINLCHEKRDDARKKLSECLSRKKELKAKIAAAKAKLGPQLRSSLIELTDKEADATADFERALATLQEMNDDFESGSKKLLAVGNELRRIIGEMQKESA